jgi:hypothetical protein
MEELTNEEILTRIVENSKTTAEVKEEIRTSEIKLIEAGYIECEFLVERNNDLHVDCFRRDQETKALIAELAKRYEKVS